MVNQKGEVLVVNQKGTSWSLPKGHIEAGEKPVSAAKREIYEESGITNLEFVRELGSYKRYRIGQDGGEDHSELKTIFMFLFKTNENSLKPIDPENPEARWVEGGKVVELLTHPRDREFFIRVGCVFGKGSNKR